MGSKYKPSPSAAAESLQSPESQVRCYTACCKVIDHQIRVSLRNKLGGAGGGMAVPGAAAPVAGAGAAGAGAAQSPEEQQRMAQQDDNRNAFLEKRKAMMAKARAKKLAQQQAQ